MQWTLLLVLGLAALPAALAAEPGQLTVTVHGLEPPTGSVEVSLFNSAESWLKEPFLQQTVTSGEATTEVVFVSLPEGDYAVVVVHDANGNGKLDSGFLGLGGERYGFSNNPFSLLGRPSWDAAHFALGDAGLRIEIALD